MSQAVPSPKRFSAGESSYESHSRDMAAIRANSGQRRQGDRRKRTRSGSSNCLNMCTRPCWPCCRSSISTVKRHQPCVRNRMVIDVSKDRG
jgi:hypothetical protein